MISSVYQLFFYKCTKINLHEFLPGALARQISWLVSEIEGGKSTLNTARMALQSIPSFPIPFAAQRISGLQSTLTKSLIKELIVEYFCALE